MGSVQRYTKDYYLVLQRSRMPASLRERGVFLREHPSVLYKKLMQNTAAVNAKGCCKRRRTGGQRGGGGETASARSWAA